MKRLGILFGLICAALVAGCISVDQHRAVVEDQMINNPSLGLFGFSFEIPEAFELYNSAVGTREQYGELQQLAIRIYNLNRAYHPRGNESFYDSFLMLSEKTGVLLMTLTVDNAPPATAMFADEVPVPQGVQIPFYNISAREIFERGENQREAVRTRGHAYEHKGWYYANERRKRNLFQYEAYRVAGGSRDLSILMGFCLPGDEDLLSLQMQDMMQGLRF